MDPTLIAVLAGGAAGGAAGGMLTFAAVRSGFLRHVCPHETVEDESVDADVIDTWDVDGFASEWARRNGRPAAAGLVAEKLRLAEQLQRRRQRRGWAP